MTTLHVHQVQHHDRKAKIISVRLPSVGELTPKEFKILLNKLRNYHGHMVDMVIEKRIGIFKVTTLEYQSQCLPCVDNSVQVVHTLLESVIERKNANLLAVSIWKIPIV